jgi:hypothetical protein
MTEDGAVLNLDTTPYLQDLLAAKTWTAQDMETMRSLLSGLGLQLDLVQYYDSLDEALAAAANDSSLIAKELTWTQNIDGTEGEAGTQVHEGMEVYEDWGPGDMQMITSDVLMDGASDTTEVTAVYRGAKKTVRMNPVSESTTQTATGISSSVESEGSANTKPKAATFRV